MEQNDINKIYLNKYECKVKPLNFRLEQFLITKSDIEHTFNIIEAFYKRQDDICYGEEEDSPKIEYSIIKDKGKLQAPKVNPKDNIYFSTDHHGDLSAFMFSLLESGVAKFKEGGPSTIYFDMNTNSIIENKDDIKVYIEKNGTKGLVPYQIWK